MQRGRVVWGAGIIIRRSRIQGRHPVASGICFSVVPCSNPRSLFFRLPTGLLLKVGIFIYVTFQFLKYLFPLYRWHDCKIAQFLYSYIFTFLERVYL